MLLYELHIPQGIRASFTQKVAAISGQLGIDPDWLMAVMWQESRLRPEARNPVSGATGLIQFMPATAASLGTSVDALAQMSAIDQLDYVYRYYLPYAGKLHSFADAYFAVFFPAAIGKPATWVLESGSLTAAKIAQQNSLYDVNRDGRLTVAEVMAKLPDMDALKKK
jgi:hypothetical protein